ncbi:hypothetical protein [Pelagibacterium sp. H642]|uniref:hypothetical protein n=1 Tax=Pelagibacterium sp. H642 TaxID=1881069 RepID=UPI002815FFF9|nr:hypothetical protein [Pelagibacterium sp. H642]WMT92524.1 hypothetical protein NO934_19425 [Pelagibacterium sp. H642]
MPVNDRVKRCKTDGAAADLVRVEVLVPASGKQNVLDYAQRLRAEHRAGLEALIDRALERYGPKIEDNIDLSRLANVSARARVVGRALLERGDAAGFKLGRQMLDRAGYGSD